MLWHLGIVRKTYFWRCQNRLQPVAGRSTPLPTWLLPDVPLSLRFRLTHCCELHVPVTKRMTRTLADCCVLPVDSDPYARRQSTRLLDLSSKEGQDLFDRCIRKPNVTFFDLLCSFPACKIPIVRLLELLPRLLPRPYTLLDSPQRTKDGHQLLSFVFSRVDFDPLLEEKELAGLKRYQYRLHGVCTGFLERVWGDHTTHRCCFPVYLRRNLNKFQLPDDPSQPVIMIGAGTGLAPFMSFMRSQQYATSIARHPLWLIFGCRSPLTSLLFAEELGQFLTDKILSHCCLCFSRYNAACADPILPSCVSKRLADQACVHRNARYVQHCVDPTLTNHREQLTEWVLQRNAKIMVCGEAKSMAPAIMEAWVQLISTASRGGAKNSNGSAPNLSEEDFERGREYVKTMRSEKRYIEDIWS
ncbi:unnamed protein product [Calicophoron daubneyi]|uniref:FAD-binding FR-type domain-containing protein n=1 Tax=Calicophoron daubneyi TaxID=300641 RepID=A0AAV2TN34_CALDB